MARRDIHRHASFEVEDRSLEARAVAPAKADLAEAEPGALYFDIESRLARMREPCGAVTVPSALWFPGQHPRPHQFGDIGVEVVGLDGIDREMRLWALPEQLSADPPKQSSHCTFPSGLEERAPWRNAAATAPQP